MRHPASGQRSVRPRRVVWLAVARCTAEIASSGADGLADRSAAADRRRLEALLAAAGDAGIILAGGGAAAVAACLAQRLDDQPGRPIAGKRAWPSRPALGWPHAAPLRRLAAAHLKVVA